MYEAELKVMIEAAKEASAEIMKIYRQGFQVKIKEDASPVTDADIASNTILKRRLSCFTSISWLGEEDSDNEERLTKDALFIVDPLDGTADFVKRDDSFGINIALVVNHKPVASVVAIPVKNAFGYAIRNHGSYYVENDHESRLHVSDKRKDLILLQSNTTVLDKEKEVYHRHSDIIKEVISMGACTKAIYLAQGKADASVRYTPYTKEWDTCAPELIVQEAGGIFLDTNLKPFVYNRKDVHNHIGYCMFNRMENAILLK